MKRQDNWMDRTIKVQFIDEDPPEGQTYKIRKFNRINGDATPDQLRQCFNAISSLTPNDTGTVLINVYDHLMVEPE